MTANRPDLVLQRSLPWATCEQTRRRRRPIPARYELVRHSPKPFAGKSHLGLEPHDVEFGSREAAPPLRLMPVWPPDLDLLDKSSPVLDHHRRDKRTKVAGRRRCCVSTRW